MNKDEILKILYEEYAKAKGEKEYYLGRTEEDPFYRECYFSKLAVMDEVLYLIKRINEGDQDAKAE